MDSVDIEIFDIVMCLGFVRQGAALLLFALRLLPSTSNLIYARAWHRKIEKRSPYEIGLLL